MQTIEQLRIDHSCVYYNVEENYMDTSKYVKKIYYV